MKKQFTTTKELLSPSLRKKYTAAYGADARKFFDGILQEVQTLEGYLKLVPIASLCCSTHDRNGRTNGVPIRMNYDERGQSDRVLGDLINITPIKEGMQSSPQDYTDAAGNLSEAMRYETGGILPIENFATFDSNGKIDDITAELDVPDPEIDILLMNERTITNGIQWLKEHTQLVNGPEDCMLMSMSHIHMRGWYASPWKILSSMGIVLVGGLVTTYGVEEGTKYRHTQRNSGNSHLTYSSVDCLPFLNSEDAESQMRSGGLFGYNDTWTRTASAGMPVFFVVPKALYDIGPADRIAEDDEFIAAIEALPSDRSLKATISKEADELEHAYRAHYCKQRDGAVETLRDDVPSTLSKMPSVMFSKTSQMV
jgi:hypothetical protein